LVGHGFDDLTRRLAASTSRRGVLRAGIGLVAALVGVRANGPAEAAAKRTPGQTCRKDDDCASRLCGPQDTHGRRQCALCATPSDCPQPTTGDACHAATCDANGVCGLAVNVGAPCDNGDQCTVDGVCRANGKCVGTPLDCDDGLACTKDLCSSRTGCVHKLSSGFCLIDGVCVAQNTRHPNNPCQVCTPSKSPTAWSNVSKGKACDDATRCNGREVCDGHGTCQPGEPVSCDPCEVCDPATGKCVSNGDPTCSPCAEGAVLCGGQCVRCVGGTLRSNCACVCPRDKTLCRGECVDLDTDSGHCGHCDLPCNGGTCSGGVCICASGTCRVGETCSNGVCSCCGFDCFDTVDGSPSACVIGGCAQDACFPGEVCAPSRFAATCECGDSGAGCASLHGEPVICVDGTCCAGCPSGEVGVLLGEGANRVCGCTCGGGAGCGNSGSCVDGQCACGGEDACGEDEHCSFDLCCPSDQTNCGGVCKDTSSDPHFCGACIDCGSGATCSNYACVCSDGATPCPELEHCTNGACECGDSGVTCADSPIRGYCHTDQQCYADPDPQLSAIGRRR
jgi:hypothetical protein